MVVGEAYKLNYFFELLFLFLNLDLALLTCHFNMVCTEELHRSAQNTE